MVPALSYAASPSLELLPTSSPARPIVSSSLASFVRLWRKTQRPGVSPRSARFRSPLPMVRSEPSALSSTAALLLHARRKDLAGVPGGQVRRTESRKANKTKQNTPTTATPAFIPPSPSSTRQVSYTSLTAEWPTLRTLPPCRYTIARSRIGAALPLTVTPTSPRLRYKGG